jgi:hypothetical protein
MRNNDAAFFGSSNLKSLINRMYAFKVDRVVVED